MFEDIFVRLEQLISKNQKFFKSDHSINLDQNPIIILIGPNSLKMVYGEKVLTPIVSSNR